MSRMYASMMAEGVGGLWERFGRWVSVNATRLVWLTILGLVVILPLGWAAHTRGRFSVLKSHLRERISPPEAQPPRPGGQDALLLQRALLEGGGMPEFVSATLLPGRGLNTLQITAYLPGKGEVPLLASSTVAQAAVSMNGQGADANGGASLRMGGAMEVPWAGEIFGAASPDGGHIFTQWHGHSLTLPVTSSVGESARSDGGLLLAEPADSVTSNVMPDGGEVQAVYQPGSFGDRWPSKTEVSMTVLLSSRLLDLRITAKNTGTEPEPVGIGWAPRFAIPSGDREQVTLRMPTGDRMEKRHAGWHADREAAASGRHEVRLHGARRNEARTGRYGRELCSSEAGDPGLRAGGGAARSEEQLQAADHGDDPGDPGDACVFACGREVRGDCTAVES